VKKQLDMPITKHRNNMPPKKCRATNTGHSITMAGPLMEKILLLPEIREDKVLRIQHMIGSGTYRVDSRKIASAMLREL
jgi:anti-sigma28 factor (negative regulator of flagellin synthesis)